LLALVLALLALAVFPVLAQADSGGAVYENAPPTVTGHKSSPTHSSNPTGQKSDSGGGATAASGSGDKEPGSESSSNNASGGGGGDTGTGGGTGSGQTSPGDGSSGKTHSGGNGSGSGALNKAQPVSNATESSDDSSSSPLIPILIAIVLLAAISIGAVIYRQRRQRPGSVSPKAS
jgi:cobalamin biosynthesis Mg chelatase CobN